MEESAAAAQRFLQAKLRFPKSQQPTSNSKPRPTSAREQRYSVSPLKMPCKPDKKEVRLSKDGSSAHPPSETHSKVTKATAGEQKKEEEEETEREGGKLLLLTNGARKEKYLKEPSASPRQRSAPASLIDISVYDLKAYNLEKVIQNGGDEAEYEDERSRSSQQRRYYYRPPPAPYRKSEEASKAVVVRRRRGGGRRTRASISQPQPSVLIHQPAVAVNRATKRLFKSASILPPKGPGVINRSLDESLAVKVWIGTWNCENQDFELDRLVSAKALLAVMSEVEPTKQTVEDKRQPLADWITPGYGVYVVTLQEAASDTMFAAVTLYLQMLHPGHVYKRVEFDEDKISGYGDGALLAMKSTSIACWVRRDLLRAGGPVSVGSSKAMPLNSLNGSKGGVSIVLRIHKQHVCFIGCHMPAGGPEGRRIAREYLSNRLSELYCGLQNVAVTDVFHHILWAGDFNLRVHGVAAADALRLLTEEKHEELFMHDELRYNGMGSDFVEMNFVEGRIGFSPTYKKKNGRPPVDRSVPGWAEEEYHTQYTAKWYKGGYQEERCPAWTDRVFKWSMPELDSCLLLLPHAYCAASPVDQSVLLASDHSPVGCGFSLYPLNRMYSIPPTMAKGANI
eukprot:GHVS01051849.1.p1 GENE.GHVS01051849.1~~GHVS01051849.1.p1  ORF type:complete len:623 (+),score=102.54 GHVS01051849.1:210-2078(+)